MTTIDRLREWEQTGIITDEQRLTLAALVRKERFSVFVELSALLYLGVLSLVGGLGWTFWTYSSDLGDAFILGTLSLLFAGALYYCFSRSSPYSHAAIEAPNLAFDYVLYLGCLLLTLELAYIEYRLELLRGAWDHYLLLSAAVFFALAYRFDNRFVLSLALSTLAGWFGLKISRVAVGSDDALRFSAFAYGAIVAAAGTWLHGRGIKRHFLETYLHIAANVIFAALVSGLGDSAGLIYLAALLLLSAGAIVLGVRFTRFAFVAYGVVYGYIGISYKLLENVGEAAVGFLYLVVSGILVIIALVVLARRFGREA